MFSFTHEVWGTTNQFESDDLRLINCSSVCLNPIQPPSPADIFWCWQLTFSQHPFTLSSQISVHTLLPHKKTTFHALCTKNTVFKKTYSTFFNPKDENVDDNHRLNLSEGDRVARQKQSKIKQLPNLAVCSGFSKEALEITTAQWFMYLDYSQKEGGRINLICLGIIFRLSHWICTTTTPGYLKGKLSKY